VRIPEETRRDFFLYVDEFQNFVTDAFAGILSEARKYRLNLTVAHQYTAQLVSDKSTAVRDAVFGNAGTMMIFRVGAEDAEFLEKNFAPVFSRQDLVNVDNYSGFARILINNVLTKPFNMTAYPPTRGDREIANALKELSRLKYGRDKNIVNREIMERTKLKSLNH